MAPIVLRYFDARGRAQFIRYYFHARGIEYVDERVPVGLPFEAWRAMRDDRSRSGPFHKLPVLHYGTRTVAESLVIAAFLHRESGDERLLSDEWNLRHSMLLSSLYVDIMAPFGTLIWSDLMYPGSDPAAVAKQTLGRVQSHLASLERTLTEWRWREAERDRPPMLADCMLWEQLDLTRHVFGEHAKLEAHELLSSVHRDAPARRVFERVLAEHPVSVTGRGLAAEPEVLARIRAAVADA